MAKELPYLASYKNVGLLFDKVAKAKIPDVFTTRYLSETLGLKNTGDRQLIPLLKKMGLLDPSGKPTNEFSALKNSATAKTALAVGIRKAYAPLYEANEDVHDLPSDQLKGIIAQVSGAEEGVVRATTGTFNALSKLADFANLNEESLQEQDADDGDDVREEDPPPKGKQPAQFSPSFRFDVAIHLPANGTEETYIAIFNSLRKTLG